MLSTFVQAPRIDDDLTWQDEIASSIAKAEQDVGRLRARLSSRFGIGPESIDVITEETSSGTQISYVLIVLDAAQAAYLSDSQNQ